MHHPTPPCVLIVNDDQALLQLLSLVLAQHGYVVVSADGSEPAWSLLPTLRPHLLILDLNLPGINGQALLEQLRANPETHELPVLVLSTHYPNSCVHALADAILEKPFELEALLWAAQYLTAPRSPAREVGA